MRLWKLEIENKTNVLAFAAFVLSLGALVGQMSRFLIGPRLMLVPPDQVILIKNTSAQNVDKVAVVVRMIYVNSGAEGYSEIVLKERLSAKVGDDVWQFVSLNYVNPQRDKATLLLQDKDTTDAVPFSVDSGKVVSHFTKYVPFAGPNNGSKPGYLVWSELLNATKDMKPISFAFTYQTVGKSSKEIRCRVDPSSLYDNLQSKGWSAVPCVFYEA